MEWLAAGALERGGILGVFRALQQFLVVLDGDDDGDGFSFPCHDLRFSQRGLHGGRVWPRERICKVRVSPFGSQGLAPPPGIADRFDGRPLLTIAEAAKLTNNFKPRYRVAGTVTIHRSGAYAKRTDVDWKVTLRVAQARRSTGASR